MEDLSLRILFPSRFISWYFLVFLKELFAEKSHNYIVVTKCLKVPQFFKFTLACNNSLIWTALFMFQFVLICSIFPFFFLFCLRSLADKSHILFISFASFFLRYHLCSFSSLHRYSNLLNFFLFLFYSFIWKNISSLASFHFSLSY